MLADADDGLTKIDTTFDGDTVWLSIDQMAELFQRDRSVIGKHVRNIFKEGELQKESVWAKFAYTAADGKVYDVDYYNLDVIISVGYRVKSKRGTQLRIWATGILAVLSSLLMAFAPGLFLICAAMGLNALSNGIFPWPPTAPRSACWPARSAPLPAHCGGFCGFPAFIW